ncbi:MAG TPA: 1-acyl-sn-glycerol-3-phosphate acyltransferase, partial [Rhodomicrobium sp.]|nr:1-acyl-sn-glycerol-3-phosphate acyltransferase [Rhodomicrobium sp.]
LRYPGTIVVEFLAPIPPGLPRQEFMEKLQSGIERASNALCMEARKDLEERGLQPPINFLGRSPAEADPGKI